MNNQSILDSVKKTMGILSDYNVFDTELILHINSTFATLHQLGVGTEDPFYIEDNTKLWSEFITDKRLSSVKSYMYLKTRLLFDPPATSYARQAMEKTAEEFEWRLNVASEGMDDEGE